ncbi:bacillithiol transferase BstA [Bacillus sp. A301a_S52]|nr:bacillithiol transferase BstA [Bacillus sp. A301a_S52]
MEDLRYPIGQFEENAYSLEQVNGWIEEMAKFTEDLRGAVKGLTDQQLDTPYREGGWTVRQVVHHLPDSHMNAYIRCKWALTEDKPTIKPYLEAEWAELPDASMPVDVSLALLDALHNRWMTLLTSLEPVDLEKTFRHPESGIVKLGISIGIYAWHGRHHLAHITSLRQRMGWEK